MRSRLINWQPHSVEPGDLNNSTTLVTVHVVVAKVGHYLPQHNHILESSIVLSEVIIVYGNFLIRR